MRSCWVWRRPAVSTMQTSAAALPRARDGIEGDRARIGPLRALDQLDAGALRPALELLDGRGAERVRRADDHRLPERLAQVPGELADGRRLARAVDADDEDDGRVRADVDRVVAGAGELGEQLGEPLRERLAADEVALLRLALEALDHLGRRAGAHVGEDQRLLEALPGLLVEVALEERRLHLGAERLARLAHVLAQAAEEAAPALLAHRLGLPGGRGAPGDEEVLPVSGHGAGRIGHAPPHPWSRPARRSGRGSAARARAVAAPLSPAPRSGTSSGGRRAGRPRRRPGAAPGGRRGRGRDGARR